MVYIIDTESEYYNYSGTVTRVIGNGRMYLISLEIDADGNNIDEVEEYFTPDQFTFVGED